MPARREDVTYFSLRNEILQKKFRPIYLLQGDEPYYIDQLSDLIVNGALGEDERDFNLTICYGMDVDIRNVIATCKQYPAMSQYQVVVLREAQNVGKAQNKQNVSELNTLKFYAERPLLSTILVVCYKGGSCKSTEFLNAMKKAQSGVVLTSSKVRDYQMPQVVKDYCMSLKLNIDDKSVRMLCDSIGVDISRMFGEIDKLKLLVGASGRITPALIEENIGNSKDYNNFELEDALIARDQAKAYRIIDYYKKNPKSNPVVVTISMIYGFFSNVLLLRTARDKTDAGLMAQCGTRSMFRIKKFKEAARTYSTRGCVNIISYLRECDVQSKGQGSRQDPYDLLFDLIYKILHS